ncbi:very long chain fatty acid elongase AAEL008004-like [Diabrotica undecimpunctata]|uniref:very long chain fatty acid elongase AAEL008004-like n=1 Tax=Diabrotica undecimpunctata TaxID=50387 RepID=UPI003B642648
MSGLVMSIITNLGDFTHIIDPRHEDYMVSSPYFFWGFILTYIYSIKVLGPKLMQHRQPYNIKNIVIGYNIIQILVNLYIFFGAIYVYFSSSNWLCIDTTEKNFLANLRKYYYYLKMSDCLETVFFILRKKYQQASFLHIYHHSAIILGSFVGFRYYYGDNVTIVGGLNSIVHTFMYIYYLLTAIDSKWRNYMAIKRGLTLIQIVQLTMMWSWMAITKVIPGCKTFPPFALLIWITNNIFMISLFIRFYYKTYKDNQNTVTKND